MCFLFSCQNEYEDNSEEEVNELILEAKKSYNIEMEAISKSQRELPTGDFIPLWDKAKISSDDRIECLDIPIMSMYKQRALRTRSIDGQIEIDFTDIDNKIVFIKEKATGRTGIYRRDIIPDLDYIEQSNKSIYDRLTNCSSKENFSGIILYSTIDGYLPLRGNTYQNGVKIHGLSLFNDCECHREYAYRLQQLYKMRSKIKVQRRLNLSSRSFCSSPDGSFDPDNWKNQGYGSENGSGACINDDDDDWDFRNDYIPIGGDFFYYEDINGIGHILIDNDGDGIPDSVWIPGGGAEGNYPNPPGYNNPDPDPDYGSGSDNPGDVEDGSGGNGGIAPPNPTPLAKAIFRNKALSEANWKTIEKMLEKIRLNCMGDALFNEMKKILNGKTLVIEFDGSNKFGGSFNPSEGKIKLGNNESNVLLHELFHAYQYYNEVSSSISGSTINREIEAFYAQYSYLCTLPEYQSEQTWKNRFEKNPIGIKLEKVRKNLTSKGELKYPNNDVEFSNLIISIANDFKKTNSYSNYKFDYSRWGLDNFSNLIKLLKNC